MVRKFSLRIYPVTGSNPLLYSLQLLLHCYLMGRLRNERKNKYHLYYHLIESFGKRYLWKTMTTLWFYLVLLDISLVLIFIYALSKSFWVFNLVTIMRYIFSIASKTIKHTHSHTPSRFYNVVQGHFTLLKQNAVPTSK